MHCTFVARREVSSPVFFVMGKAVADLRPPVNGETKLALVVVTVAAEDIIEEAIDVTTLSFSF